MNLNCVYPKFTTFAIGLAVIAFSLVFVLLISGVLYKTILISSAYGEGVCCEWNPSQDYKDGYIQGCTDGEADNDANLDPHYHYDVSGSDDWSTGYTGGYYEGYEAYNCAPPYPWDPYTP